MKQDGSTYSHNSSGGVILFLSLNVDELEWKNVLQVGFGYALKCGGQWIRGMRCMGRGGTGVEEGKWVGVQKGVWKDGR